MDPVKKAFQEREKLKESERTETLRERSRAEKAGRLKKTFATFGESIAGSSFWIGLNRYFRFFLADFWIVNYSFVIFLLLFSLPTFYVLCLLPFVFESPTVKVLALIPPIILWIEWFRKFLFERTLKNLVIAVNGYRDILEHPELGFYEWFVLDVKVVADRNPEAISALLESFTIRSKKLFYPHDWDMQEPRTFWKHSSNTACGSANSRVVLLLLRDLLVKLDRLHRFEPSIRSVNITILSGPISVEARINQANSD
ncbi:hypothetical protein JWG44_01860 [Leptospira sp. 201903071]|uniref:hypothetical protein n=1 Tax=Leptospira ainazelensis TaxID=2810034 RepID=UPI00196254E0|nr:hypothetical protein [Leptospira ainazelensis]MBM9498999.1 hypothetical protein [Leptospira ainazelensis]